jgi:hypothetical protein
MDGVKENLGRFPPGLGESGRCVALRFSKTGSLVVDGAHTIQQQLSLASPDSALLFAADRFVEMKTRDC